MQAFDLYQTIRDVATEQMGSILSTARALIPLFLLGVLLYSYGKSILMESGPRIDFSQVIRGFLFFLLLMIYPELTQLLDMITSAIYGGLPQQPDLVDSLSRYNDLIWEGGERPDADEIGFWSFVWDSISSVAGALWSSLTSALAAVLIVVVREGLAFVRVILLNFLFMVGPIAIALSVVPGFKDSAAMWLKGYIGVSLWEFTLRVLDFLIYRFNLIAYDQLFESDSSLAISAFQLVCVIMYLLTPTMTNYFIRVGAAGSFVGKASGVATTAMVMGAGKLTKAKSS